MLTGDRVVYWNGKDDIGDLVGAGFYDVDICGTGVLGSYDDNNITGDNIIDNVEVNQNKPFIVINYDFLNPFYPPGNFNICYTVFDDTGPPNKVDRTIYIEDYFGNNIKDPSLYSANTQENIPDTRQWDGSDDLVNSPNAVDGVYKYRITAGQGGNTANPKYGVLNLVRNNLNYVSDTSTDNQTIIELHSDQSGITSSEIDLVFAETATLAIYQSGYVLIGSIFDLEPDGTTFTDSAVIIFNYTPTTWLDESKLDIYKYDDTLDTWIALNGIVDEVNNKIYAQIDSLSLYAVLMKTVKPEPAIIPVEVKIEPQKIKTNNGVFTVYITIPEDLDKNLVNEDEIYINGIPPLSEIYVKPFLMAKFHRQDFDNYPKNEFIFLPVIVKLIDGRELKGVDLVIFK